jgi:hypothetical protein
VVTFWRYSNVVEGAVMHMSAVHLRSGPALLAFVVVLAAAVAHDPLTVQGTVTGKHGDLKQFASVSLDGPGQYGAITDEHGLFTIQNVTPATYTVRVRQGGKVEAFTREVHDTRLDLTVEW